MPEISVVLPVRNGGGWLRDAVDSILGQSEANLELLVVDDHSDDGAVSRLPRDDRRLRVISSPGRGVVAAFNAGLKQCSGRYVARMDADDIALPHRLESQRRLLEQRPAIDIAGGRIDWLDGADGGNRRYADWLNSLVEPDDIHREMFVESPLPNPTLMARRSVLEDLGGYRDSDWPEDYDLLLRADSLGFRMAKPPATLLLWRDHPGRLTRCDERYDRSRFQQAKAHYLARHRLDRRPVALWGAGPSGREFHDLLLQQGIEVSGFLEIHPRRVGGRKRDRPVWHFERAAEMEDTLILVAVGAPGARDEIRGYFDRIGRREGYHYLFVA